MTALLAILHVAVLDVARAAPPAKRYVIAGPDQVTDGWLSSGGGASFTDEALRAVAREAMRRKAGARGLRAILEQAMLEIMYDVPFQEGIKECRITDEVIAHSGEPVLRFEKEKKSA